MRYAVLSDIHANWEALELVSRDINSRSIDQIAVLGDTVGYGASPNECFEWVMENASVVLMGNHEQALFDKKLRAWFNPLAAEAIVWTEQHIKKEAVEKARKLAYSKTENGLMFAHGSPDSPESFRYILSYPDALPAFKAMKETICFVGHTHVPGCFCETSQAKTYLNPGTMKIPAGKVLLNPGSVGQPRDGDSRLSYGVYDDQKKTFEIVRLEYNNGKAAQKIRDAGLPVQLGDRLL